MQGNAASVLSAGEGVALALAEFEQLEKLQTQPSRT
jgi:hypothetical protein